MTVEEPDPTNQDNEYDEEADSDFGEDASDGSSASSSAADEPSEARSRKTGEFSSNSDLPIGELDSGDETTIKERQKTKRKQRRKKGDAQDLSDEGEGGKWRARTRAMRAQQKEESQKKSLASIKTSTVDVNRLWDEMNKPGPLPPMRIEGEQPLQESPKKHKQADPNIGGTLTGPITEETVTIKRQFKFAGEVHVEEKVVPKSSAEAKLWLAQLDNKKNDKKGTTEGQQRPLRRISRFDPNHSNPDAFRNDAIKTQLGAFRGQKLNVVEKSKMDWAMHVDVEGLQDELQVHSRAKDAYLNRMDFLSQVEQRRENEARQARQKG